MNYATESSLNLKTGFSAARLRPVSDAPLVPVSNRCRILSAKHRHSDCDHQMSESLCSTRHSHFDPLKISLMSACVTHRILIARHELTLNSCNIRHVHTTGYRPHRNEHRTARTSLSKYYQGMGSQWGLVRTESGYVSVIQVQTYSTSNITICPWKVFQHLGDCLFNQSPKCQHFYICLFAVLGFWEGQQRSQGWSWKVTHFYVSRKVESIWVMHFVKSACSTIRNTYLTWTLKKGPSSIHWPS